MLRDESNCPAELEVRKTREEPSGPLPFLELPYFNGLGGFTPDGREYAIYLAPEDHTPAPWCNVLANSHFGALMTESGFGTAWCGNSQMNRLTPWLNDPNSNAVGEALYLRDEESGVCWTPTPLPIRELDAYRARHGQGYTVFEHNSHAIEQELLVFVPVQPDLPVRIGRLRLRNRSTRRRRLSVTAFAEWTLGTDREENQLHVVTQWDPQSQSLLARNARRADYNTTVAFATLVPAASSYTADRVEFLGRNGNLESTAWAEKDGPYRAGLARGWILVPPCRWLSSSGRTSSARLCFCSARPAMLRKLGRLVTAFSRRRCGSGGIRCNAPMVG